MTTLLRDRGFDVELTQEALLENTGLYTVHAIARANDGRTTCTSVSSISRIAIEKHIDDLAAGLQAAASRWSVPCLVSICPSTRVLAGDADFAALAQDVEPQLVARLADTPGLHVVTGAEISVRYPVPHYADFHADRLGRVPYMLAFFAALGTTIARKSAAMWRLPAKAIVLDCDDTLWNGVCGEVGPRDVVIDAPRAALQQFVIEQHRAGMLVCLCSKNSETDVFSVFEHHPDMLARASRHVAHQLAR